MLWLKIIRSNNLAPSRSILVNFSMMPKGSKIDKLCSPRKIILCKHYVRSGLKNTEVCNTYLKKYAQIYFPSSAWQTVLTHLPLMTLYSLSLQCHQTYIDWLIYEASPCAVVCVIHRVRLQQGFTSFKGHVIITARLNYTVRHLPQVKFTWHFEWPF